MWKVQTANKIQDTSAISLPISIAKPITIQSMSVFTCIRRYSYFIKSMDNNKKVKFPNPSNL